MTAGPPPSHRPLRYESPQYRPAPRYATLPRRAAATLIDGAILLPGSLVGMNGLLIAADAALAGAPSLRMAVMYYSMPLFLFGSFVLACLYHALSERSPAQATPGKRAMSLRVAHVHGRPMSFGRASARFFAKLLSAALLLVGFLVAAFSPRRQALHDMMVDTLVLRRY